jgi:glycosyltransferase involved in cell wall biosynthesis
LRIALITPDWMPNGGIATHLHLVGDALARAGHPVHVLHRHAADNDGRAGVSAERLDADARRAADQLLNFRPDIVHFHGLHDAALETLALREFAAVKTFHVFEYCPAGTKFHHATDQACGKPTTAWCVPRQGYLRCTLSRRPSVWWSQYRFAATFNPLNRTYPLLITASEYVKAHAADAGYALDRIRVVPYFTTLPARTAPLPPAHILYVGRLTREKGVDLLIDALGHLARTDTPWTCTIIGDGPEAGRLRDLVQVRGLASRVTFRGWLVGAPLADAYAAATVVVVPSRWPEPFGIVGIEAMSHGRPVVAFRVGGIPEWLQDGVTGWAVAPLDTRGLADRLAHVLDDAAGAAAMGNAGRARVARDFGERAHLARLLPIYEDLCGRR